MIALITYANIYQLLEAIGAISKKDGDKSAACGSNYQDDVSGIDHDCVAFYVDDDTEEDVLGAIFKVCSNCPLQVICL